jgi:RNA polymerase sigma-70 factor (ECF subfamily)
VAEADLSLVARRVTSGDRAAFRVIVEATQNNLFRLAARIMGNTADAQDVLQEAFVKAYRALCDGRFDGRSAVGTWLYRIVSNSALDALRRRAVRPVEDEAQAMTETEPATAEEHMALRELSEWLGELPPEQRVALVLKAVEGRTTPEIAEILGTSEGAVEQRLVRARAILRKRRGEDDDA